MNDILYVYQGLGDQLPSQLNRWIFPINHFQLSKELALKAGFSGKYFEQVIKYQLTIPEDMVVIDNSGLQYNDFHNPELQKLLELYKQTVTNKRLFQEKVLNIVKSYLAKDPSLEEKDPLIILGIVLGPMVEVDSQTLDVVSDKKKEEYPWLKEPDFQENYKHFIEWKKLTHQIMDKLKEWEEKSDLVLTFEQYVYVRNSAIQISVVGMDIYSKDTDFLNALAQQLGVSASSNSVQDIKPSDFDLLEKFLKDYEYTVEDRKKDWENKNDPFKQKK